jgi:hypothetical protein
MPLLGFAVLVAVLIPLLVIGAMCAYALCLLVLIARSVLPAASDVPSRRAARAAAVAVVR